MSSRTIGLQISLDATWPSSRIATTILEKVRDFYGDRLDIEGIHRGMDKIWLALRNDLSDVERQRLAEVVHVSVPLNDFNARIATPPSRLGYFILFDAVVDLRLAELFTAPRNPAAWSAAYVRAAWGSDFSIAYWTGPAIEHLRSLESEEGFPDSYSLASARDFIFAHECGHLFMNHLDGGSHRALHFGGNRLQVFDPALQQEVEADAFAREILSRSDSRPLGLQQIGVDWLFGFMGAVLAMRNRAQSRRTGDSDLPTMHPEIAHRRALCWEDFNRRRELSLCDTEHTPETIATIDRVRMSVDNFNGLFPPVLADIFAEFPDQLLSLHSRVIESPLTDDEVQVFLEDLDRLHSQAIERRRMRPRRMGLLARLRKLIQQLF